MLHSQAIKFIIGKNGKNNAGAGTSYLGYAYTLACTKKIM